MPAAALSAGAGGSGREHSRRSRRRDRRAAPEVRHVGSAQGDIVVTGGFFGSVEFGGTMLTSMSTKGASFVAELDASGSPVWARSFGGVDDSSSSGAIGVAIDGSNNVIVAGNFKGSIAFGGDVLTAGEPSGTFVGKLGPDGTPSWSRSFDPNVQVNGMATNTSGEVVLSGTLSKPVDFGCGTLPVAAQSAPFVVELNGAGACRWSRSFLAKSGAYGQGVAFDASSTVIVTGSHEGPIDFGNGPVTPSGQFGGFVVSLNPDGSTRWSKECANAGRQKNLAVNGDGNIFFDGLISVGGTDFGGGTFAKAGDFYLASLDVTGNFRWAKAFPQHRSPIWPMTMAADTSRVVISQSITGTIELGCGPLTSADLDIGDLVVAEFAP
jgi:hypothetical protein